MTQIHFQQISGKLRMSYAINVRCVIHTTKLTFHTVFKKKKIMPVTVA